MKANTLNIIFKSLAAALVLAGGVAAVCGVNIDVVGKVIPAAAFIAAVMLPVDVSMAGRAIVGARNETPVAKV